MATNGDPYVEAFYEAEIELDAERTLADELGNAMAWAEEQWGEEYLWVESGLSESLEKWRSRRDDQTVRPD